MSKKKSQSITVSRYELEGSLDKCIERLQEIREKFRPYNNVVIEFDYDYSDCWYEGDIPSIKIEVRGTTQ